MKLNKNHIGVGIAIALIAIILFSCNTEKKAARKEAWLIANNKLPEICADNFKIRDSVVVKDSISIDTISVKENYIFDTLYVEGDTIFKPVVKTIYRDVLKTVTKTNTVYLENTAKVIDLNSRLNQFQKDRNEAINKKDKLISDQQSEIKDKSKWKLYFFCLLSFVVIVKLLSLYLKSKKKVSPIDILLNSRHQG